MSWTQPCCDDCWARRRNGARVPTRVKAQYCVPETCAFCGRVTNGGIYVRAVPATVLYPAAAADV